MKIVSLNIEGRRHLSAVTNFLTTENPDVICLQEADEKIFSFLTQNNYRYIFSPLLLREYDGEKVEEGNLIAARSLTNPVSSYYYKNDKIVLQDYNNIRKTTSQNLLSAEVLVNNVSFNIITTHFTWNPHGEEASEEQSRDLEAMLGLLSTEKPHILCGDFNIPRNLNSLYKTLIAKYKDNIPVKYGSSLDKNLHRLGKSMSHKFLFTNFMVDYLFTLTPYDASTVRLEFGISDHAAVVGDINRLVN